MAFAARLVADCLAQDVWFAVLGRPRRAA